jgi:hypothetical protein
MSDRHAVHYTSKTPEHYTPAHVLERVEATLGRSFNPSIRKSGY